MCVCWNVCAWMCVLGVCVVWCEVFACVELGTRLYVFHV